MENQPKVDRDNHGEYSVRRQNRAIAELAERQHGVVSRAQLLELGVGRGAIDHRLKQGRLYLLHRGIYALAHRRLTRRGHWMAAVLCAGNGAALSHSAAAALLGLRPAGSGRIDVALERWLPARRTIVFHQAALPADEVTVFDAIAVTTVPRTLMDLASVLDKRQVERAMEQAERLRLTDPLSLPALVERYPGRRGVAMIRQILDEARIGSTYTRSDLEEAFLAFVRAHSLPSPELNAQIELSPGRWIEADCLWRAQRLIVELDSRGFHDTARAFESDRARDRAASVGGWTVIRVTWRQLHDEPSALAGDLHNLLANTAAPQQAVP